MLLAPLLVVLDDGLAANAARDARIFSAAVIADVGGAVTSSTSIGVPFEPLAFVLVELAALLADLATLLDEPALGMLLPDLVTLGSSTSMPSIFVVDLSSVFDPMIRILLPLLGNSHRIGRFGAFY